MRKELDEQLCKEFPNLFRDRHAPMNQTCMCWGFACDNGWFDLIRNLCLNLKKIGAGDAIIVTQVKEKFGGLRFYYVFDSKSSLTPGCGMKAQNLIEAAEAESLDTCELCGKPGALMMRGYWCKTLCGECAKKEGYMEIEESQV